MVIRENEIAVHNSELDEARSAVDRLGALQKSMAALCDLISTELLYFRSLHEEERQGADLAFLSAALNRLMNLDERLGSEMSEVAERLASLHR